MLVVKNECSVADCVPLFVFWSVGPNSGINIHIMKKFKKIKEKNDEIIDLLTNYNQNRLFYRKNNRKK